jgi:hypothetical protein
MPTTVLLVTTRRNRRRGLSRRDRKRQPNTTDQERASTSRPTDIAGRHVLVHHHHTHALSPMASRITTTATTTVILLLSSVCAVGVSAFQFHQPTHKNGYVGGSRTLHHDPSPRVSLFLTRGHDHRANTNIFGSAADVDDSYSKITNPSHVTSAHPSPSLDDDPDLAPFKTIQRAQSEQDPLKSAIELDRWLRDLESDILTGRSSESDILTGWSSDDELTPHFYTSVVDAWAKR